MSCLRLLQSAVAIAMSVVLFAGIDLNADKDHSTLDGQKSLANKGERLLHILTYGAAKLEQHRADRLAKFKAKFVGSKLKYQICIWY